MKMLVIVRHAHDERKTGNLDPFGLSQIAGLTARLKPILSGCTSVEIISSSAPRAMESALKIADEFKVSVIPEPLLWTGRDQPPEIPDTLKPVIVRLRHTTSDAVILVVHMNYSKNLPSILGDIFAPGIKVPSRETKKGNAWVINIKLKTCVELDSGVIPSGA